MVTERALINALIIGASLILVPFLISSTLTVDFGPALFLGGFLALLVAFFFLKDSLCIWPLLGSSIAGSLNFLPLPLTATHIFCLQLILYYVTGYVLIRKKHIKLGKTAFVWPILIIAMIVLYHNHDLNVRVLGGDTEGAKPAILLYLVVLAYFCGINIESPSINFISKVPLYAVILTAISNTPFFLSTFFPSLAPYLYYITDNVNVEAYLTSQSPVAGTSGAIGRLGALGPLGGSLQLYLICHYPIGTWLRPSRWWVIFLSLFSMILVLETGFRNNLFGFFVLTAVGIWCYYSWRSIYILGIALIVPVMLLVASSDNLIQLPEKKLPLIAQRTLSFLPGDWDQEALESAKSSNDFRKNIQDVYIKEYLYKSPWIGNGFNINKKEYDTLNNTLKSGQTGQDPDYLQAKTFIEGKLFHTGWISLYDHVGLIGSLAFIALGLSEIRLAAHLVFGPKADRRSPLFPFYVWVLCNIVTLMVSFFTVFGDFSATFSSFCIYAIVLSQLSDIENAADTPIALAGRKPQLEFSRSTGAHYGYQPKS
jgi:hypothetical protein